MTKRILVVEDEPGLRRAYTRAVSACGADVSAVGDVASALALLETQHFDCAILDRNLPDGDGIAVAETIKAKGGSSHIIICTGYPDSEAAVAAFRRAGFDYLTKPFNFKALVELVRVALARQQP